MKHNIDINVDGINQVILKQKEINKKMAELFKKIEVSTNKLKDSWDTRTSKVVFDDFERLYKIFNNINTCNVNYTNFLENVVSYGYTTTENNINNVIDNNIAI